jgi:hypothetical protein
LRDLKLRKKQPHGPEADRNTAARQGSEMKHGRLLWRAIAACRLGLWVALALVCGSGGSAFADTWNFTYTGNGGDTATGSLTTTTLSSGQATITGISGSYDGGTIIGLIPSGTCCSSPPNDNVLYYPGPYLDLPGLGFQTGSFAANIYLNGTYQNLTAPLNNVNQFTLVDSGGAFTVSRSLPVNIYADAFIPAATLDNPGCIAGVCLPGSGGYPTFAGDNRGVSSAPGDPFRIAQAITVDVTPGVSSPVISSQNNVGATIGFDTSGNPTYAFAPTSGLTESATENSNGVTVQINGSGSNPLVPLATLGPIVQQYTIDLSPGPDDLIDYTIQGATKFFPGYELYIGCQLISGYDPASTGSGPGSLLVPISVSARNVIAGGAISASAADGCGPGTTQNFAIQGTFVGGGGSSGGGGASATFEFDNVPSGSWVDPASASIFQYTMLSDTGFLHSDFTEIEAFRADLAR